MENTIWIKTDSFWSNLENLQPLSIINSKLLNEHYYELNNKLYVAVFSKSSKKPYYIEEVPELPC